MIRTSPLLLAVLTSCGAPEPEGPKQTAECAAYMECLLAVLPSAIAEADLAYGQGGTCWEDQESADLCTAACSASTEDLHDLYPDEVACGIPNTEALFGSEQNWDWTATDGPCGDAESFISGASDWTFTIDFLEWIDGTALCTLESPSFSCDLTYAEGGEDPFIGTFSNGYSEAQATLGTGMDRCTYSGERD